MAWALAVSVCGSDPWCGLVSLQSQMIGPVTLQDEVLHVSKLQVIYWKLPLEKEIYNGHYDTFYIISELLCFVFIIDYMSELCGRSRTT